MNKKELDAVVAGTICLDITPVFIAPEVESVDQILIPSKTVRVGPMNVHVGGCVSNTGLAMAYYGNKVRLMGKIGRDDLGQIILNQYREYTSVENIVISDTEGSSYSDVIAPRGIDRIFLHYPGCNESFGTDDIDFETVAKARLFHFGYPPVMKKIRQNNGEMLIEMYRRVKELDVTTSMDTCGIDANDEAAMLDWRGILRNVLPWVDIFTPSIEELCFMLDRDLFRAWEKRAGKRDIASVITPEDVEPIADLLLSWGAKILMIKCGTAGIYFAVNKAEKLDGIGSDLKDTLSGWADARAFERCYKPREVKSAIGAGDTCIAAFLTGILRGAGYEMCLKYAAGAGALCVEGVDALSGLIPFEEMDRKIRSGWEKA